MATTRVTARLVIIPLLLALWATGAVHAESLKIADIQYVDLSIDQSGASPCAGQTVDCAGGIVTHIWEGSRPRLILQDRNNPNGWGAIQVKGWSGEGTFAGISVGDYVSFTDVYVEEYRGTTFLQFGGTNGPAPNAGYTIHNRGNPLPEPMLVMPDQIAAPLEGPPEEWYVADHSPEPYESMWLTVEDVTVTDMYLGKGGDNYNLHGALGDAWASDYQNSDKDYFDPSHPCVQLGRQFASVTGILEQYTNLDSGWDYYQLLTTSADDLQLAPEPSAFVILLTSMGPLAGWALLRHRRS